MDSPREIACMLQLKDQLVECLEIQFGEALSLRNDPVLKVAGKQLAGIEAHCLAEPVGLFDAAPHPRGRLERGLKPGQIGADGIRVQLHGSAAGEDHGARGDTGRLELVAQRRKREAEFVASGARLALGPELLDQRLARMGSPA